jgi:hypothetical protein
MGLIALVARLEALKAGRRESRQRRDALLAEYEATLPAIPDVLFYTKRDSLLFCAPWGIGEPLAEHVNYFHAWLKGRTGGYRIVGGEITFVENREAKVRAKEILRACKDWIRTQNDHSRAIGLMRVCDDIDDVECRQSELCRRISRIRAQSLESLKLKAIAARNLNFDLCWVDLINESIVRDLHAMTRNRCHQTAAPAPEALVA